MKILIASKNGYKIRETKAALKVLPFTDIFSMLDFPVLKKNTIYNLDIENHIALFAKTLAVNLSMFTIVDTSQLCVAALNNQPGINSSIFAGNNASDKENIIALLKNMSNLNSQIERSAYMECYMSFATPCGQICSAKGVSEGFISHSIKGSNGFGYDPIFYKHDYQKTLGELSEDVKNKISHRSKALKKLFPNIEKHLFNYTKSRLM